MLMRGLCKGSNFVQTLNEIEMRALIYILVFVTMTSCQNQIKTNDMENLDKHLQSLVDKEKTPSVSYLLFNENDILHEFRSGNADISGKSKVTDKTTYTGFSVTKTFTALAILQLAEKELISIEDRVVEYVPDFPYGNEITIRQLLSHSGGLPNPLPLKWIHSPEENSSFDRNEFYQKIFEDNPKVKSGPNEKFSYSNLGFFTLGRVIENVTGEKYENYIRKSIIDPLGIEETELGFEIRDEVPHAKGYQKKMSFMNFMLGFLMDKSKWVNQTEGKWISFNDMLLNGASHGGLIGTPASFAKYIQGLLRTDGVLISEDSKKMLFEENLNNSNEATGMCLSWFKGELNGRSYYSHAGGGAGYYCEIRIYPEEGVGSVVMFNRTGVKDERILSEFDKYYFQDAIL